MQELETPTAQGSAAAYRKAVQSKPMELVDVTVPSGFVWKLRKPDLEGYIMTGRLPQSLVEQFLEAAERRGVVPSELQQANAERFIKTPLNKDESMASLIFVRELVREACVVPRIVIGGVGNDEIDPTEVDPEDFKFIRDWCLLHLGVVGLGGLQKFPSRRQRRASGARARRKGVRRKAQPANQPV